MSSSTSSTTTGRGMSAPGDATSTTVGIVCPESGRRTTTSASGAAGVDSLTNAAAAGCDRSAGPATATPRSLRASRNKAAKSTGSRSTTTSGAVSEPPEDHMPSVNHAKGAVRLVHLDEIGSTVGFRVRGS